jgi:ABC-2 type transport system permease protein
VRGLVSAELLKLRTTRTAFGFLTAIVLLTLAVNAANFATSDFTSEEDLKTALSGTGIAAAFLMILGIVGTTGEYRHSTITSTLLATPERARVVAGKLLAYLIAGAVLGAAAIVVTYAVGIPWLSERDAPLELLGVGDYLELAVRGIALAALSGALGVGIGAIVRNQVAAVVGTLVYLFILEPVVSLVSSDLAAFTIGGAQTGLGSGDFGDDMLDPIPAGLVVTGWVLLLGSLGALVEEQRDVT